MQNKFEQEQMLLHQGGKKSCCVEKGREQDKEQLFEKPSRLSCWSIHALLSDEFRSTSVSSEIVGGEPVNVKDWGFSEHF